jgi:hypothetical protein
MLDFTFQNKTKIIFLQRLYIQENVKRARIACFVASLLIDNKNVADYF